MSQGRAGDEVRRPKNRSNSKVWAKVEPVFAVVKRLRGFTKVVYRGLVTNASRAFTALALADFYPVRGRLTGALVVSQSRGESPASGPKRP